ncbi:MAG: NADH-quinone oxidoreductase subunit A [bacterium]
MAQYVPILVHFAASLALVLGLLGLHVLLGGRRPHPDKLMPYESGVWPVGSARERVPVRYYLVAMLFILFDVEAVFLYPWAVLFRQLGWLGLWEILVFVGVLLLGYVYAWRRGAFQWQP